MSEKNKKLKRRDTIEDDPCASDLNCNITGKAGGKLPTPPPEPDGKLARASISIGEALQLNKEHVNARNEVPGVLITMFGEDTTKAYKHLMDFLPETAARKVIVDMKERLKITDIEPWVEEEDAQEEFDCVYDDLWNGLTINVLNGKIDNLLDTVYFLLMRLDAVKLRAPCSTKLREVLENHDDVPIDKLVEFFVQSPRIGPSIYGIK